MLLRNIDHTAGSRCLKKYAARLFRHLDRQERFLQGPSTAYGAMIAENYRISRPDDFSSRLP